MAFGESFMRIAHRGAPNYAPESTLPSFQKAIELKSNYLELDVHQTSDNVLVIMHDTSVNRTTNGKGKIKDFTFAEIQKLDAGGWFSEEFKNEKIPTLDVVLDLLISNPELKAIIELKNGDSLYPGMEKRVADIVHNKGLEKQIIFKSFDPEVLARLKKISPSTTSLYVFILSIPSLPFTINTSLSFQSPFTVDTQYLQAHYYFLTENFVKEAHEKGYKVVAWGVDTEKHMHKALDMSVDGIETDYLDLLEKVITERLNKISN